jgi:hypothetical protein
MRRGKSATFEQTATLPPGDRSLRQGRRGDTIAASPGCGSAPIEACRKADGVHDYPLTAVRLGRFFGLLSNAVVEAGRA